MTCPLGIMSRRDITTEVIRGLNGNSPRWQQILKHPRGLLPGSGCQLVQGSMIHRSLQDGSFSYRMYSLAKV